MVRDVILCVIILLSLPEKLRHTNIVLFVSQPRGYIPMELVLLVKVGDITCNELINYYN